MGGRGRSGIATVGEPEDLTEQVSVTRHTALNSGTVFGT